MLCSLYARCANELGGLYPSHVKDWWPMVEDIFKSPRVTGIKKRLRLGGINFGVSDRTVRGGWRLYAKEIQQHALPLRMQELVNHEEFQSLSIDATMRCCLPILGQAHPRASAIKKAEATFSEADSKRRVARLHNNFCPVSEESCFRAYLVWKVLSVNSGLYCARTHKRRGGASYVQCGRQ